MVTLIVYKAIVVAVGNERRIPVCKRCNDKIWYNVCGAVMNLKSGKLPGINEITVEYLKRGGPFVLEWLVRMFNMHEERVVGLFLCLKAKGIGLYMLTIGRYIY